MSLILAQAADIRGSMELWERHATHLPVIPAAGFNTSSSTTPWRTPWRLDGNNGNNATTRILENGIVLQSPETVLEYTVPANSSLVRVLGPSLWSSDWIIGTEARTPLCTVGLDPLPPWSASAGGRSMPVAWQHVHPVRQVFNSTLFLLPLDPAVTYTLKVYPPNDGAVCAVSGVTAYPFQV